ncbi:MAG TPA: hypothetical protein VNK26_02520 [Pyrinomonadaceae bacterium]|nr:hypothetical protein [Pyrinomonadaceae bacterium]
MENWFVNRGLIHYLPILTTLLSTAFFFVIFRRFLIRRKMHLLWWSIGVATYGLGTLLESIITLFGNNAFLNKSWYIAGAILGGFPLAQGSAYLHLKKKHADLLTAIALPIILIVSIFVAISPVNYQNLESFRPSGAALEWQTVRLLTPFINLYSAIFLIGTAAYSAFAYLRHPLGRSRAFGNGLIAFGALLPGIGGAMAKGGVVEALYVGECLGIMLIWIGYDVCQRSDFRIEEGAILKAPQNPA